MKTAAYANSVMKFDGRGINLEETLFCGQSFSWWPVGGGRFAGVAGPHAAEVWQDGDRLFARPLGQAGPGEDAAAFWAAYFDLDTDYAALHAAFAKDGVLAACLSCAPGIRLLNQPFFDTLLSFIISQNNNIPRITGIVERLREGFGPPLSEGVYGFPAPQALAACSPEDLAPLRAGFRAKYLLHAAQLVAEGRLNEAELRALPTEEARRRLMEVRGVGPKVADCVLLFSLSRREVVPMDVWMKRAMAEVFPAGLPACATGQGGVAQQYIFAWARQNLGAGRPPKERPGEAPE